MRFLNLPTVRPVLWDQIYVWIDHLEAATQRCSSEKVLWKYAANLQENTHAEVQFQRSCFATLLKSHFGMSVLL